MGAVEMVENTDSIETQSPSAKPATKPARRRGCLRFGLRSLMIFVVLFCIASAWLGMKLRQYQRREAAVERLQAAGAQICYDFTYEYDYDYHNGIKVAPLNASPFREPSGPKWLRRILGENFFSNIMYAQFAGPLPGLPPDSDMVPFFSDEDYARLSTFSRLQELYLASREMSPFQMSCISRLTELRVLTICDSHIPDDGLSYLKPLSELQVLDLGNTELHDCDLLCLENHSQLRRLDLPENPITDIGFIPLSSIENLEMLDLCWTAITDTGLIHLKRLEHLNTLYLGRTAITDAGLIHLKPLKHLEDIELVGTSITDAGLKHLEELSSLKWLDLWGTTQLTEEGVARLRKVLPNCEIRWFPPSPETNPE